MFNQQIALKSKNQAKCTSIKKKNVRRLICVIYAWKKRNKLSQIYFGRNRNHQSLYVLLSSMYPGVKRLLHVLLTSWHYQQEQAITLKNH